MPTIEEIHDNGPSNESSNNRSNSNTAEPSGFNRIVNRMMSNKIDAALWLTRLSTMVFALCFYFPLIGNNPNSHYQRCLLSNAISSALRLHQRLPNFQFTKEYLTQLFLEDSAHYLIYSIIFLTSSPISMTLLPLFLYALLHAQSYSNQLLNIFWTEPSPSSFLHRVLSKVRDNQVDILRFIACSEIFLMPMIVFLLFVGQGSLLLPFLYSRFLSLRYSSRRNPYCKQLFQELRIFAESLCARPQCPQLIRSLVLGVISFICRLAPAV